MGRRRASVPPSSPTADRILLEQEIEAAIGDLAVPHRQKDAYWKLRRLGAVARGPVEDGLLSEDVELRVQCTLLIDHLAGNESFELMIMLLDDPDHRVRKHAIHALACDRCKGDDLCPLPRDDLVDASMRLLGRDPHPRVRAIALEVLARWVHDDPAAREAIERAASGDPSPAVRKKAAWYLPGGRRYEATRRVRAS